MTDEELVKRFGHHPPKTDEVIDAHQAIRSSSAYMAGIISEYVPPGREQSLAFTAIEEAMFWANAGIARNQ